MVNNLRAVEEIWVQSLGHEDPLQKERATHSSVLPGEFHVQRSLVGYSPWVCKKSDMPEGVIQSCGSVIQDISSGQFPFALYSGIRGRE